jgi:hypothetical protein
MTRPIIFVRREHPERSLRRDHEITTPRKQSVDETPLTLLYEDDEDDNLPEEEAEYCSCSKRDTSIRRWDSSAARLNSTTRNDGNMVHQVQSTCTKQPTKTLVNVDGE